MARMREAFPCLIQFFNLVCLALWYIAYGFKNDLDDDVHDDGYGNGYGDGYAMVYRY